MPVKYHIHTEPAAPRVRPVGKLGIVDWREDCSNCHNCVKKACVYGFYRDEADRLNNELGYLDYIFQCKGCLNCIQDCTKGILTRVVNPEYNRLGDHYYKPETILSTWYQAETGRIPVSGAGYGGPFTGPGFDSMWTDMSEIVRPTRDGIHGREYINVSVDIGRRPKHLAFEGGRPTVESPPLIEIPLPIIFDVVPEHFQRGVVPEAIVAAADEIGSMVILDAEHPPEAVNLGEEHVVPRLSADGTVPKAAVSAAMVLVPDSDNVLSVRDELKAADPRRIVAVRVPATPVAAQRVKELADREIEVVQLAFDVHGREAEAETPRHVRDVLREVHGALIEAGTRDQISLCASGGIIEAEHIAKALICGADFVSIDLPLVVALECRLCRECEQQGVCSIALEEIDIEYATRRIVNLMGAWCNQLIELLGAMGIREARRLRGETGRCMFFEDLEADTFGRLFGKRKAECETIA